MALAYLGIGSNIGDRKENFREALRRLDDAGKIEVKTRSSFYKTRPVGGPKQADYLNGVIGVKTGLTPRGLLRTLKGIERSMGRRKAPKNHPRVIDLDILFYDDLVMNRQGLVIPHPRVHERAFVRKGLLQIAPGLKDPVTGEKIKNITAGTGKTQKQRKVPARSGKKRS